MQMIDNGEKDDKIIAVASNDPSVNHIQSIEEMPEHFINVLKNFFQQYKVLENKQVEINEFQNKEAAYKVIDDSIKMYNEHFPKNNTQQP